MCIRDRPTAPPLPVHPHRPNLTAATNRFTEYLRGSYAPTTGWVNAGSVHLSGDEQLFTLRVDFVMTEDQLTALRCAGEYLEISAPLRGFSLPDQFDGYSVSSDLPEYLHDLANFDDSSSLSPGLTRVPTTAIEANRWYYLELKWQDDDVPGSTAEAGLLSVSYTHLTLPTTPYV